MCGRTVVSGDSKTIARRCFYSNRNAESVQPKWRSISTNRREERENSDNDASENQQVRKTSEHFFEPSFNIGPQSKLPVLVSSLNLLTDEREDEKSGDGERCLTAMRWGLQREFMKDSSTKYTTFNCRAETLLPGPSQSQLFKQPLSRGFRCAVVVDGFFEWKTSAEDKKQKQPYFVHAPQSKEFEGKFETAEDKDENIKMLVMAGIYNPVKTAEGETENTCTIITVESSHDLKWLHHRMPAILPDDGSIQKWLDAKSVSTNEALKLLSPFSGLQFYPVDSKVGNIRCNEPSNLERVVISRKRKGEKESKLMLNWLKSAKTTSN